MGDRRHAAPTVTYPDGLDAAIIAALPALRDRLRLPGAFIEALLSRPELHPFDGITDKQVEIALGDMHSRGQFDPEQYIRPQRKADARHRAGIGSLAAAAH
jgi:hypothetical protein